MLGSFFMFFYYFDLGLESKQPTMDQKNIVS